MHNMYVWIVVVLHGLRMTHSDCLFRYVQSWIDGREIRSERANLLILFDRYIPTCLETLRTRFKKITPITDISMIQTLCYLLEALLTPENTPPDTAKEVYELYFVFAAVWAFGGSMFQDQVIDPYHTGIHMYIVLPLFPKSMYCSHPHVCWNGL